MEEIPEGWIVEKLSNIIAFESKTKRKAGEGQPTGKYPFFTSSPIQSKFVDEHDYDGEYLIFGTGGSASVHYYNGKFSTSTDCFVTQVIQKGILPRFLYLYLSGHLYLLEKGFHGAGLKHISKEFMRKIPMKYPKDIRIQEKIISILDKSKETLALQHQANARIDDFLKSTFIEMFGDPVKNPKGWDKKLLGEITVRITDGKHGDCIDEENSGYYFISAKDIHDANIDYSHARQIRKSDFEEVHRRTDLCPGDLVIVNTGATIGKMAIAQQGIHTEKTTFQKSVAVVKCKSGILNVFYLKFLLELKLKDLTKASSGSAQHNLLLSQMRKISINLPPPPLQQKFAIVVQHTQKIKAQNEEAARKLEDMFNVLKQKAFKGELIA
ncbi:MAG: restriction endonuclease subunit S [Thermoplasmata archaeon]|nr:restriction endonuclease subunit S [Thermoplasmata archaeon]